VADFFVSYTSSDRAWAEWIAWQLEDAGYTVLVQAWDMVPGSNWLQMMNQATIVADRTVAVLSKAYLTESAFGEAEWLAAYRRDPSGLAGRVIPIRVDDCTPEGLLAGIVYADLVGLTDPAATKKALLDAVQAALSRRTKPLVEPDFPGNRPSSVSLPTGPAAFPAAPPRLSPQDLSTWRSAVELLQRAVDDGIRTRSALTTSVLMLPSVRTRLDRLREIRDIVDRYRDHLDEHVPRATLVELDALGQEVCADAWPAPAIPADNS
jgi:hypothetical protein